MATAQLFLRRASSALFTSHPRLRRSHLRAMAFSASFQKIQIHRGDTTFDAYVVGKENAPGIVVLQEWWGVDFEIKNHAIYISQIGEGYRALIPDLYRGKVGLDVAEAQHLMEGLDWQGAVKDIQASVNWLKANGSSKRKGKASTVNQDIQHGGIWLPASRLDLAWWMQKLHIWLPGQAWEPGLMDAKLVWSEACMLDRWAAHLVGVTGYCMGGALSIASGVLVPEVDAVAAFYGIPSAELADPSKAKAPIQAHFGELDSIVGFADITAAKSLEEKLKLSGVPHEVHIYPGCAHAFMNISPEGVKRRKGMGMNDENKGAVELAWSRFTTWMGRFLGSA